MGKGRVLVEKQVVEGRAVLVVRGRFLGAGVNDYTVSDGFFLSLSMCKREFHDLQAVFSIDVMWVHFQF